MKGKNFLLIGGIVAAGIIAYGAYKCIYSGKKNNGKNGFDTERKEVSNSELELLTEHHASSEENMNEAKVGVISSIRERHYEAVKTMENSLNTIFYEQEVDNIVTENSETLERISGKLDDLLE